MANTVTRKQLDSIVERINRTMQAPMECYSKDEQGDYRANIGNYHLSGAYGGFSLHRMVNESGGVSDVFQCGHVTKRELASMMYAFLKGIDLERTGV